MSVGDLLGSILDVFAARPIMWMLLFGFAGFAGAIASESLERKRGLLVTLYAMAAVACFGAATSLSE